VIHLTSKILKSIQLENYILPNVSSLWRQFLKAFVRFDSTNILLEIAQLWQGLPPGPVTLTKAFNKEWYNKLPFEMNCKHNLVQWLRLTDTWRWKLLSVVYSKCLLPAWDLSYLMCSAIALSWGIRPDELITRSSWPFSLPCQGTEHTDSAGQR
jgi:hypothetical protein